MSLEQRWLVYAAETGINERFSPEQSVVAQVAFYAGAAAAYRLLVREGVPEKSVARDIQEFDPMRVLERASA